jgi:hypothetical protein
MRAPILLLLLVACNDDNKGTKPDLSVSVHDLGIRGDAGAVTGCDVVSQDCPSKTDKCVVTDVGTMRMPMLVTTCVPGGNAMVNQPCTRSAFGVDDNCTKGTECTLRGVAMGSFACRTLCHSDTDCASNERCTDTGDGVDGLCVVQCRAFGNDCTGGLVCGALYFDTSSTPMDSIGVLGCRSAGSAGLGGSCVKNGSTDCQAGLTCNPFAMAQSDLVCVQLCEVNGSHHCSPDADGGVVSCQLLNDQSGAPDNGICSTSGPQ